MAKMEYRSTWNNRMAQKKIKKGKDIRMTNGDKIRAMSDEELANFLANNGCCENCIHNMGDFAICHALKKECEKEIEIRLKKEVE